MQVRVEHRDAIVRKYPEACAIAIAKDPQGKYNPIPLGYVMKTSGDPAMFAVSIGKARYSYEVFRQAEEFVLSFPSIEMKDEVIFFGYNSGADKDKIAESGAKTSPAEEIDGVLLSDAVANFECKMEGQMETGDHVIFVGRVVASHMNQDPAVRRIYILGRNHLMGGARAEPME